MMIDLHLHSTCSDGSDSPSELVEIALNSNRNIKAIALTDHDSIYGLEDFLRRGEEEPIICIPGIEISIKYEPEKEIKDVHVVGLNIDHESRELINTLKKHLKGRIEQKKRICSRLREEFGFTITFNEIRNLAGNNSIGKPHIVEILIKNNPQEARKYTQNELFQMISIGGKAHVFREFELNLREATELIASAGGITILAHPGIYEVKNRKKFILECMKCGIKGLEVEYTYAKNRPYYNTSKSERVQEFFHNYYRGLAEKYDLIKSGGSDYHGRKKQINIGDAHVPDIYLKNIL